METFLIVFLGFLLKLSGNFTVYSGTFPPLDDGDDYKDFDGDGNDDDDNLPTHCQ